MIILKRLKVENFKLLRKVDLFFPRQGSVLVEGLNESGKSTLFESIFYALYGSPLVTEGRGKGNLESTVRYGEDSMAVELLLEVDETELEIRRAVKRNKASQARLLVRRPGALEEQVTGVLAVNARIVDELGGLDGEALLNSCFVEQKKLSKLEDLASGQRKDSLRKLLNLDRLTTLAERFRVTPQDERALAEARGRLDLAQVAAQLPAVAAERSGLEAAMKGAGYVRQGAGGGTNERQDKDGRDSPGGRVIRFSRNGLVEDIIVTEANAAWQGAATRLDRSRQKAAAGRRASTTWTVVAAAIVAVSLVAALLGVQSALWGLLLVPLPAFVAWRSSQSAKAATVQTADLEAELSALRDTMVARSGELEARQRRAEEALGIEGTDLDLDRCESEVERLTHQIEMKRRAAAIVEGAMERIVRMVLPNTERNLGQILPLLTAGRYHEARIGEDYQVQVWDDSAGRYVSKAVFSGGARDQFSLALRLAFALATLPEELGTAPSFIFLDEPLSSFDGPRTEALVRLLTEGQVAANFSQIFVISHNRSFDPNAFEYRLVLRDGRVVESNLPAEV